MRRLDLTLDEPAQNLALDEALLESAECGALADEVLRIWEPAAPLVVLGRSSLAAAEVNLEFCAARHIPVLRRASGGAAIVTGPGCLMYAVLLEIARHPPLALVDRAHRWVLERVAAALRPLAEVQIRGTSDLAVGEFKVSGNSLRRKRAWLLYHGTLVYGLEPALIAAALHAPPRQPDYRRGRPHAEFVGRLPGDAAALRRGLIEGWDARETLQAWPRELTEALAEQRYRQASWNLGR